MASEVKRRMEEREPDPLRSGCLTVLRPVLTTAAVAAIGFLPMALSTRAGAEVQRPLATVVIGGVLSSTVLSLLILPVLLELLVVRRSRPQESEARVVGPRSVGHLRCLRRRSRRPDRSERDGDQRTS